MIDFDTLKKQNKTQIKEALVQVQSQYPALASIDPDEMTKAQMLEASHKIIAAAAPTEFSDQDKKEAVADMLRMKPEAVILPTTQTMYRLYHPKLAESVTVSAYSMEEAATTEVTPADLRRRWHAPEDDAEITKRRRAIALTPTRLDTLPSWAHVPVYNALNKGDLVIYTGVEEAQEAADIRPDVTGDLHLGTLLDDDKAVLEMRVAYIEGVGLSDENRPITMDAKAEFSRPEQHAAWNVLNGKVGGKGPLPADLDVVAHDPGHITDDEIRYVRDRIERCLTNPEPFLDRRPALFDKKVFFNQLLETEFKGYTPPRPGSTNKTGGFRPQILQTIREIVRLNGYEVFGDYVAPAVQKEIKQEVAPTIPIR